MLSSIVCTVVSMARLFLFFVLFAVSACSSTSTVEPSTVMSDEVAASDDFCSSVPLLILVNEQFSAALSSGSDPDALSVAFADAALVFDAFSETIGAEGASDLAILRAELDAVQQAQESVGYDVDAVTPSFDSPGTLDAAIGLEIFTLQECGVPFGIIDSWVALFNLSPQISGADANAFSELFVQIFVDVDLLRSEAECVTESLVEGRTVGEVSTLLRSRTSELIEAFTVCEVPQDRLDAVVLLGQEVPLS